MLGALLEEREKLLRDRSASASFGKVAAIAVSKFDEVFGERDQRAVFEVPFNEIFPAERDAFCRGGCLQQIGIAVEVPVSRAGLGMAMTASGVELGRDEER